MTSNEPEYPGVPHALRRRFERVFAWGLLWTVTVGSYASGAFLVALVVHPELVPFVAMGATTLVIHVVGVEVRGETEPAGPGPVPAAGDRGPFSPVSVLVAAALGALLLWSAAVALVVAELGRPVVAVVVAFGYPLLDRRLRRTAWFLSVAALAVVAGGRVATWVLRSTDTSPESVETVTRRALTFY